MTDLAHIAQYKGNMDVGVFYSESNSLIAIQGPKSQHLLEMVLSLKRGALNQMPFMTANFNHHYDGVPIIVSRCGYTGEDGFEVSVPNDKIEHFMEALMEPNDESDGTPIG